MLLVGHKETKMYGAQAGESSLVFFANDTPFEGGATADGRLWKAGGLASHHSPFPRAGTGVIYKPTALMLTISMSASFAPVGHRSGGFSTFSHRQIGGLHPGS